MKWIFILLLVPQVLSAQLNKDSLRAVWHNHKTHDTTRLKALHKLVWEGYLFSFPDSALVLAEQQYNLARNGNYKKHMALATNSKGIAYALTGKIDKSLVNFEESYQLNLDNKDERAAAASLNNIGLIYKNKGDYRKAIDYYSKSVKIREKIKDTTGTLNSLNNISLLYLEMEEYKKVEELLNRCLKLLNENKDIRSAAITHNNFGKLYNFTKENNKAISSFQKSKQLFTKISDHRSVSLIEVNLGVVYRDAGKRDSAEYYLLKARESGKKINDLEVIAGAEVNLAAHYLNINENQKALKFAESGFKNAKEYNSPSTLKEGAQNLYEAYKRVNQPAKALEMFEYYQSLNDSLKSEENKNELLRQEYQYEYDKQLAADSIKKIEEKKVTDAQFAQRDAELKAKTFQQWLLYGGLAVVLLFAVFMYNRFKITNEQKNIIEDQKHIVEEKNKEILDSINYAKRIQSAILPPDKLVKELLPDSFILYKPKDIVAGDFYWLESFAFQASDSAGNKLFDKGQMTNTLLFAACDCTGHGVPGALVSVVCNNALNRSVREYGIYEPGKILDKTKELILQEFEKSEEEVKDGMDIALVSLAFRIESREPRTETSNFHDSSLSFSALTLKYAGAHNPLWIIRDNKIIEIAADKQPVGKFEHSKPFTTNTFELQKNDTLYIFTDGFSDQFGGDAIKTPGGKKFKSGNFKKLLLSVQDKTMEEQKKHIELAFENWKGDFEQVDDVCVIGIKI